MRRSPKKYYKFNSCLSRFYGLQDLKRRINYCPQCINASQARARHAARSADCAWLKGLGRSFKRGDAFALANTPLILARHTIPVAVHLDAGAVSQRVIRFGT